MHTHFKLPLLSAGLFLITTANAQNSYRYSVDLNKVTNDQLTVELITPAIAKNEITFYFPKIVPGTYMNSNYGKYVHDLKAFDKNGKQLTVAQTGDNSWHITNATTIYRITYNAEDTWDSDIKNKVYTMCGTNFEAGKNFVINTPGLFGHFEDMKKLPYDISFTKPAGFYAATGLKAVSSTNTNDVFHCVNTDELYDSPIMFSLPDTATIKVGNTDVLVAIYSPHKMTSAKFLAEHMKKLLMATKDYLMGRLPVDKYAFIWYFNGEQKPLSSSGAWEHSYSSFYSVGEAPQDESIGNWVDIASHEFFHIVTPLTISSREVKEFNFNETHLSRHVWLYEGSTEYYAHHVQVWGGLITPEQYLESLAGKINYSRSYFNDSLSFTELSTESAGKHADQYNNVYMKGDLISACLDLYLLKLSGNMYHFKDLKHDLGVRYGKDKFFEDADLFDEIERLTYPGIKEFLLKYVQGTTPIPYETFFALAGVQYIPRESTKAFTLGNSDITVDSLRRIIVSEAADNDAFGKKLGYMGGDELISLNGEALTVSNASGIVQKYYNTAKEGDPFKIVVKRKNEKGKIETITLSAPAMMVEKIKMHQLRFDPNATKEQLELRKVWLNTGS
ncbi:MAG TPA: peptidase M61 [Chitinophagaceae bacterium]|jgi:predicted metalloprotease with PDZ domain|nr:peptidase M61 [Chitinophagaceae bacterium]